MKSPDEIKKALECCFQNSEQCVDCPYYPVTCDRELVRDAREYIRQLEAERDAMMQDMNRSCFICKHFNGGVECLNTVCAKCVRWCNWEWRGLPKEE